MVNSHSAEKGNNGAGRIAPGVRPDMLVYLPDAPKEIQSLLNDELYPEDAYADNIYWADLPRKQRSAWIERQYRQESVREFREIWASFKRDPLTPFGLYFRNYVVTGLGFFTEGYTLFSVGNILVLFQAVWHDCFKIYQVCNKTWVETINYLEIVGIIFGQIVVGIIGDWIGRRWGIIQDALIMFMGTVMLTAMWGTSLNGWVICYAFSLWWFGVGVGGEYPMTSIMAMEGVHGKGTTRADKLHRGRSVALAFLMQGWGQVVNQVVLILLLLIFHGGGNPPYSETSAQYTFRVSFAFIAVFLLLLIYIRVFRLRNADHSIQAAKRRSQMDGYDFVSLKLVSRHYWHRLLATSVCWFCNDFPFYGNQIFRNVFLQLVTGNENEVMTLWLYNLINVGCELVGYYLAALLIDHKAYGRKRMQAVGFLMSFILYIIAAAIFPTLDKKGPGGHTFEFIYFFSSFWIQFGPNSTTFLLAAEVYPVPVRATAHGFSAAVGKLGALAATVLYNYIGNRTKFWVVCWFALLGFCLTVIFVPDTTGLDLREQERYWQFVREGRENEYHGIAIHPRHLSWYERFVLHRHKNYNPNLDGKDKLNELRKLYEQTQMHKVSEDDQTLNDTLNEKAQSYFEWEKKGSPTETN
ncbi:major facilitator superfamily domain-containing protein [Xylogone sp. PMI_703]|nr:major facilitator superfamily domain-containing protein [Xylogone sp. PMI_703]